MDSVLSWFVLTVIVIIGCIRFTIKATKEYDEYQERTKYEDDQMWLNLK